MSASGPTNGAPDSPQPAEAIVEGSRGFSPIWLIPIVAIAVAAGFAYQAIENRGVEVIVIFDSAEGLTGGKSVVKYRDVKVGTVDKIEIRDSKHIEVHCTLNKSAHHIATEGMRWWVVRPRISGGAISGLETIISGAYLTFEPGKEGGKALREFTGLETPPLTPGEGPGLRLTLHTDYLAGVDVGSNVFFRDIHVGDVLHYSLADDGKTVEVKLVIYRDYVHLVTSKSRFWNAGGIDLSVGPSGLDIKTESLTSILAGGVAFDSPAGGDPAKAGDAFWLERSWAAVNKSTVTHGGLRLVLETGALGGVAAGNPVYYREVPVGSVVSHELAKDGSRVRIQVNIENQYASLVRTNSKFWNASGISANLGLTGLHVHAESLKALLTGGVAFATETRPGGTVSAGSVFKLHPEAKKDWLEWESDFSEKKEDAPAKKHHGFFHHEDKTEEEAKQDDRTPEPTQEEHKHGFLHRLFHSGD